MTTETPKPVYSHNDLKWIVTKEKPVLLKLVLENYDCDLDRAYGRSTLLTSAATVGNVECLQLLLDYGASINQVDQSGLFPLHWAASEGNYECVKSLLKNEAAVDVRTTGKQRTALMFAAQAGFENMAKLLVEHGADLNAKDVEGKTALQYAEKGPVTTCIQLLLNNNGQPNTKRAELQRTIAAIKQQFVELEKQLNNYE